jgi:hypothetical protein
VGISLKSKRAHDEGSLPIERATPPPAFKNRAVIQATNRLQGSIMKRVSGMAARCAEFFSQVLPFSLILVSAGNSAGYRNLCIRIVSGPWRKQMRRVGDAVLENVRFARQKRPFNNRQTSMVFSQPRTESSR